MAALHAPAESAAIVIMRSRGEETADPALLACTKAPVLLVMATTFVPPTPMRAPVMELGTTNFSWNLKSLMLRRGEGGAESLQANRK